MSVTIHHDVKEAIQAWFQRRGKCILIDLSDGGELAYHCGHTLEDLTQLKMTTYEVFLPQNLQGQGHFDYWSQIPNLQGSSVILLSDPMRMLQLHRCATTQRTFSKVSQLKSTIQNFFQWLKQLKFIHIEVLTSRVPTALYQCIKS
jgi:hypothetical protein